jgi:hypothetical protein
LDRIANGVWKLVSEHTQRGNKVAIAQIALPKIIRGWRADRAPQGAVQPSVDSVCMVMCRQRLKDFQFCVVWPRSTRGGVRSGRLLWLGASPFPSHPGLRGGSTGGWGAHWSGNATDRREMHPSTADHVK